MRVEINLLYGRTKSSRGVSFYGGVQLSRFYNVNCTRFHGTKFWEVAVVGWKVSAPYGERVFRKGRGCGWSVKTVKKSQVNEGSKLKLTTLNASVRFSQKTSSDDPV